MEIGGVNHIYNANGDWVPVGQQMDHPQLTMLVEVVSKVWETLGKLATDRTPKENCWSTGDLEKMADVLKNVRTLNVTNMGNMETILDMLALEDTLRVDISKSLGMSNAQLMDTVDGLTEAGMSASRFGITVNDLFTRHSKK